MTVTHSLYLYFGLFLRLVTEKTDSFNGHSLISG
jgi:hypothetical protein